MFLLYANPLLPKEHRYNSACRLVSLVVRLTGKRHLAKNFSFNARPADM